MCIVQRAGYVRRTANTYIVHVRHIITYKLKDIANDQIHGWTGQEISARRLWGLRGEPPDGQGETLENWVAYILHMTAIFAWDFARESFKYANK